MLKFLRRISTIISLYLILTLLLLFFYNKISEGLIRIAIFFVTILGILVIFILVKYETYTNLIIKENTIDPLTGIYNRRYLLESINREVQKKKRRYKNDFSIMVVDVDNFKSINDTYGHLAGDLVLRTLAQILKKNLRKVDVPCRYGGEEFVIILPGTKIGGAKLVANKIREQFMKHIFNIDNKKFSRTLSAGVTEYKSGDVNSLIKKADKALYLAKRSGKNLVVVETT